ncbi:hypothetical protein ONZ45_g3970 [Pleurotus djamor]|nr:hypothetical protein ONZ45_g3970 [Pleurotus djamor]
MALPARFSVPPRRQLSHGPSPLSTPGIDAEFEGVEIVEDAMEGVDASEQDELKVTFNPPLVMQRRIWVLDTLRKEGVTSLLDIGCGEGQLLDTLAQPAPWLLPPPPSVLPSVSSTQLPTTDEIINLHIKQVHGLDISEPDLAFAKQNLVPPPPPQPAYLGSPEGVDLGGKTPVTPVHIRTLQTIRWEELGAKLWLGGVQVPNEEFLDIECIVSSEVIEHLPEHVLPFYAPVILGIYRPRLFLVTTPSYTFNARFTPPDAPRSARKGYPDPTGRTDRVFRHDDHKFEWTLEEFKTWCTTVAEEWGYDVEVSSIGRSQEIDPYGRDESLGGASQVAAFRRKDGSIERRDAARNMVDRLWEEQQSRGHQKQPHTLYASEKHAAHPRSEKASSLQEISQAVKERMEEEREAFVRFEEAWFDPEISTLCGGEEGSCYGEGESSEEKDWESTAAEGDVSWNGSEIDDDGRDEIDDESDANWGSGHGWGNKGKPGWGFDEQQEVNTKLSVHAGAMDVENKETLSGSASGTSTAGWDGDASSDTS